MHENSRVSHGKLKNFLDVQFIENKFKRRTNQEYLITRLAEVKRNTIYKRN